MSLSKYFFPSFIYKSACAIILFFGLKSFSVEIDYKGYMRASPGINSQGGRSLLINNKGSTGNEFRLGNEATYGESSFLTHIVPNQQNQGPYFDVGLTLAFDQAGNSQYSDTSSGTPYSQNTTSKYVNTLQVIEAYVQGGRIDGSSISYWAGKRFYRSSSIHMNDFFYFADMSGNGGGLKDISFFGAHLNLAYLIYSDSRIKGTNGHPAKQVLDIQIQDIRISDSNNLHFWWAEGYSAPGTGLDESSNVVDYKASGGRALGVNWAHAYSATSVNNLAIVSGSGVMESLTLNNHAAVTTSAEQKQSRVRIVDNFNSEINSNWGLEVGLIYEQIHTANSTSDQITWHSVGARPIYYFSDFYQVAFEIGQSIVKDNTELDTEGNKVGQRELTRITLSPAVVLGKGYFKRPVIRSFITHGFWNEANKHSQFGVARNYEAAFVGLNNSTQVGLQAEVWF